ncbi:NAD(P)/FAD-dependent oxidoreductase [Massilia sp. erpn]|uniref:NAD(P)/FAD-dependent oxidoreductase n=1 Tax=Massilia sp. erpn TaxID=2738142 RepID=UPI002105231B|nr:FAD-dependent oxidoreductase [Massilia sp. erpn]UTY60084.1 FAD-dependent oxidoreductase [Massilia sp. erpn]
MAVARILILGGGYAGLSAAARLSKLAGAAVTLVDANVDFVERIRLHQVAAGQAYRHLPYADFLTPRGVDFVQAKVLALDPEARVVILEDGNAARQTLGFDYLVYALGSSMDLDSVPGVRQHALSLGTLAGAQRIQSALAQAEGARALVVGGGLSAIETAAELAESFPHLKLTLGMGSPLKASTEPAGFCGRAVDYLHGALSRLGIAVQEGDWIKELDEHTAHLADGSRLAFDACIWTSGFKPAALAAQAGLRTNAQGQILTDASLRSLSHPHILAIGDAAAASTADGGPCRMSCATGLPMGGAAARTIAALLAGEAPPPLEFGYLFRNVSLGRRDGLIQFVDARDRPRDLIWTGRQAAQWKEYICTGTLATIGFYPPDAPPMLPPLRMMPQILRARRYYA